MCEIRASYHWRALQTEGVGQQEEGVYDPVAKVGAAPVPRIGGGAALQVASSHPP